MLLHVVDVDGGAGSGGGASLDAAAAAPAVAAVAPAPAAEALIIGECGVCDEQGPRDPDACMVPIAWDACMVPRHLLARPRTLLYTLDVAFAQQEGGEELRKKPRIWEFTKQFRKRL